MKNRFQRIYPYLNVLLAYAFLAYLFHGFNHSITGELFGAGDGFTSGLPTKIFAAFLSPWNPYVQLGKYSFLDTQYQHFYLPGLLIFKLFPTAFGYNIFILFHYIFAGFFTYLFCERLKLNRFASFLGGICFMFSGFLSAHKGHQALMSTAIWLPLSLYFLEGYFQKQRVRSLVFYSLTVALSVLGGFPQITAFASMVMVLYSAFRVGTQSEKSIFERLKLFIFLNVFVFGGAVLLSAVQLLPVSSSLHLMTREKLTYASFSEDFFPIWYALVLFIPNLFGGLFGTAYYGTSLWPNELHGYMGILPTLFAVLAFLSLRKISKEVWFWFSLLLFCFVLSLGSMTWMNKIIFHIPVLNLFRAPARHLYEMNFAVGILAAYFTHYLTNKKEQNSFDRGFYLTRAFQILVSVSFLFFTILFIVRKVLGTVVNAIPADSTFKMSYFMTWRDAISFFLTNTSFHGKTMVLLAGTIAISGFLLLKLRARVVPQWTRWMLVIFIFADLGTFGHFYYYYPDVSFLSHKETTEEYAFLTAHESNPQSYRIFPIGVSRLSPHLNLLYGEMAINDYSPMWTKDYKAVSGFELNGDTPKICQLLKNPQFLAISSTKYLLTSEKSIQDCIGNSFHPNHLTENREEFGLKKVPPWKFEASKMNQEGSLALSAHNSSDVSLAAASFGLSPSTFYRITFEARRVGTGNFPLFMDFYTDPNFDRPEHDVLFDDLSSQFQQYTALEYSGLKTPKATNLRFYTQSSDLIEVRKIRLERMNSTDKSTNLALRLKTKEGLQVYENLSVLPRLRFISHLKVAKNIPDFLHHLNFDPQFDLKNDAYIQDYKGPMSFESGSIKDVRFSNNEIELNVSTGNEGFLTLSDTWFPGWHATVDHVETPIYKVNALFRGIVIKQAGEHQIKFWFNPPGYHLGLMISLFTFLVGIGFLVWDRIYFDRVKKI